MDKLEANKTKFIKNSIIFVNLTQNILDEILNERKELTAEYSKIPAALKIAKSILELENPNKIICGFIDKSYDYWDKIANKDSTILTEHLDIIFGENEYISKIQYLYVNNYVSESKLNTLWKLLLAFIHNSVKYIHFSKTQPYHNRIIRDDIIKTYSIDLDV